jgi:hypothetical protein
MTLFDEVAVLIAFPFDKTDPLVIAVIVLVLLVLSLVTGAARPEV